MGLYCLLWGHNYHLMQKITYCSAYERRPPEYKKVLSEKPYDFVVKCTHCGKEKFEFQNDVIYQYEYEYVPENDRCSISKSKIKKGPRVVKGKQP